MGNKNTFVKFVKFCSPKSTLGRPQLRVGESVESQLSGLVREAVIGWGDAWAPHEQRAIA